MNILRYKYKAKYLRHDKVTHCESNLCIKTSSECYAPEVTILNIINVSISQ